MKNFFPLVLDSTQLAAYKSCPIRFFRNHVQHLQSEESIDLIAGGAFAHGIHKTREAFYSSGLSADGSLAIGLEALEEHYGDFVDPWKPAKSVHRMMLALESYFTEYSLKFDDVVPFQLEDGSYSIEYSLLHAIEDEEGKPILHPILGLPLLYSGRLDMLAQYAGGVYQVDEKTTGSYFSKNWANQWETRGQFTGYSWLAKNSGIAELEHINGAIIRGVCLPSSTATNEDTKQKFYSNIETIKHQQTLTTRNDYEIETWHRSMVSDAQNAVDSYIAYLENNEKEPEKFFLGNFSDACTSYGRGCQFQETCKSKNGEKFLETLEQNIWLPEEHMRVPLDTYLEELHAKLAKGDL